MISKDKKYVQNLLNTYGGKKVTKLDQLKELDRKASKKAKVFSYVFGVLGALILGLGMSIAMKIILDDLMIIGILIGLIGITMVIINYFIYKKLLVNGRNKYAKQITELSNEILNEQE